MTLTHILVDFENTQPAAAEVALVQGADLRLWIFRGPSQKKYDAEFTEALQPLGDRVGFIRCEKSGRNALDMHIAFQLGRLAATAASNGSARPQFVVVSRDTDYEPLLQYLRAQGYSASRVPSIKAALGTSSGKAAKAPARVPAAARPAPAPAPAKKAAKATKASKAAPPPASKPPAPTAKPATKSAKKAKAAPPPAAAPAIAGGVIDKLIKQLRDHPKSRPVKRKPLESFIGSRLPAGTGAAQASALVEQLVARGLVRLDGSKVEYPAW